MTKAKLLSPQEIGMRVYKRLSPTEVVLAPLDGALPEIAEVWCLSGHASSRGVSIAGRDYVYDRSISKSSL